MSTVSPDISKLLDSLSGEVNAYLQHVFIKDGSLSSLSKAINYSLFAPGKRIRPILTILSAQACGVSDLNSVLPIASAFELVHTYSLVHDDLPSMDNDDLRRGLPTSHRVYGEAVAILVGDALQARAFELITNVSDIDAEQLLEIVRILSVSVGWVGMVGGQYLDIDESRTASSITALRDVHDRKTGALICGAIEAGAVIGDVDTETRLAFARFGVELGWLFQLVDDLLDATGDTKILGKTAGKDASSGKVTALDVYGSAAKLQSAVDEQFAICIKQAAQLPNNGGHLSDIVHFIHSRDH